MIALSLGQLTALKRESEREKKHKPASVIVCKVSGTYR